MAIPALVVGIALGAISGSFVAFGMCLLAPFVIVGSIVAFILSLFVPPLRPWGLAFLMLSLGLGIGMLLNYLVVGVIF